MPLSPEQREERRSGIGGSDAAAVLGVHPYLSPLGLYLSKVYDTEDVLPNEAADWGNRLESVIREAAAERLGETVSVPPATLRHRSSSVMLANLDGVLADGRILECKAVSGMVYRTVDSEGIAGVLAHHYWQVQHYCEVTEAPGAVVAYLINGQKLELVDVPRDRTVGEALRKAEERFWYAHVVPQIPPPNGSPQERLSLYERVHAITRKGMVQTDAQVAIDAARAYVAAHEAVKAAEEAKEAAKADLAGMIGPDEGLDFGPIGKVTYRADKRGKRTMRVSLASQEDDE